MRQENRTLFNFNTNTESLIRMYPSRAFIWRLLLSISPDRFGFLSLLVSVQFTPARLGSQRVSKLKHSPWHSQCDKIRHKKIYYPSNFQPTGSQNLVPVTRSVKTRLWQCSQFTTLYFRRGCNHDVLPSPPDRTQSNVCAGHPDALITVQALRSQCVQLLVRKKNHIIIK